MKAAIPGMAMLAMVQAADAAQSVADYNARIAIGASCAIIVSDLDFGVVGTISTHTASAPIQVNCSSGTPWQLSFSNFAAVTSYAGTMTSGAAGIAYSATLSGAGGTGLGTLSIMGLVPAQPTPAFGIYSDTRTVYLNY